MCDYQSIAKEDRVPTDIVFPDYLGETYNFYPNATHRFYYLDGQMPDEVCLIKCFDSSTSRDPCIAQCKSKYFRTASDFRSSFSSQEFQSALTAHSLTMTSPKEHWQGRVSRSAVSYSTKSVAEDTTCDLIHHAETIKDFNLLHVLSKHQNKTHQVKDM